MPARESSLALFAFAAAFLVSCAPTRDPIGLALQQGRVPDFSAPESLTVDLDVRVDQKGAPPFSARLYVQPRQKYRIDILGFGSQVVASWFWIGGNWTLFLNGRGEIWRGTGDSLSLEVEGVSIHLPYIHALFGFVWGEPLPGFRNRDDSGIAWNGDTLGWSVRGTHWEARFNPSTGVCVETRSETLSMRYSRHHRFGDRIVPVEAAVFTDGEPRMVLRVKKIQDHPVWKKDPFFTPIHRKSETVE